jgi:hypothetical protein
MNKLFAAAVFITVFSEHGLGQSFQRIVDVDNVTMSVSSKGCKSNFRIENSNAFGVDYKYTTVTYIASGEQIPETWGGHLGPGKLTTFEKDYPSAVEANCRVMRTKATLTVTPTSY